MSYEFWDRDSLYEEVWATPMAKLAKKYGISDVGLAKVCRKLAIPLPGRGYWAKREAGQPVQKLPLPALKEPVRLCKPTPHAGRESAGCQSHRARRTVDLKRGSMSHPLIVQAREILGRSNRDGPRPLVDRRAVPGYFRVESRAATGAAAGLITALEEEGFKFAVKKGHKEKTTATLHNQAIGFTIVEKIDHIPLASPPKGGVLQRVLTYAGTPHAQKPSGRLGLQIWQPWNASPKNWNDGKTRTLEDLLPDIVAGFLQKPNGSKQRGRGRLLPGMRQQYTRRLAGVATIGGAQFRRDVKLAQKHGKDTAECGISSYCRSCNQFGLKPVVAAK